MSNTLSIKPDHWLKGLFFLAVIELLTCGSGRVISIGGSLTLRMILFLFSVTVYYLFYIKDSGRISKQAASIYLFYLFTIIIGVGIGLIQGNLENLIVDIKTMSFFIIFPFWGIIIQSSKIVKNITKIIIWTSLIMAILYLLYLIAFKLLGLIDFSPFYDDMSEETDIKFRGTSGEIFYKGFIFLPIGLLFWLQRKKWIPVIIITIAIYFTLTRGFYVITIGGVVIYYILKNKLTMRRVLAILIVGSIFGLLILYNMELLFDEGLDRSDGDLVRVVTLNQVIDRITPLSFIIGHGLGVGVPIRDVHMENSILEIFHKQGLLGLCFWLYFLICVRQNFKSVHNPMDKPIAATYYIGVIDVYIQSLFNPYLINTMGSGFVMLSYFCCAELNNSNKDCHCKTSLQLES